MASIIKVNEIQDAGSNTILSSDGSGTFTPSSSLATGNLAMTPSFKAYPTANQVLANSTWTKITLNAEDFDTDNTFDSTTNYRFTVPTGKTGKYFFSSNIIVDNMNDGDVVDSRLYINGTAYTQSYSRSMISANSNAVFAPIDLIVNLNAGDYVELYGRHTFGSDRNVLSNYVYFAGYKLIGV